MDISTILSLPILDQSEGHLYKYQFPALVARVLVVRADNNYGLLATF
jgi:hypothetical protein